MKMYFRSPDANLKLKDASQTWTLLYDIIQPLLGKQTKSSEYLSYHSFLIAIIKYAFYQLDKQWNNIDVEFFQGSQLAHFAQSLFSIYQQMLSQNGIKTKGTCHRVAQYTHPHSLYQI